LEGDAVSPYSKENFMEGEEKKQYYPKALTQTALEKTFLA